MNPFENCFEAGLACQKSGDYAEAVRCYRQAAEQGNAKAQRQLGYCHIMGLEVENDVLMAFHWLNKAVKRGDTASMCFMGACYTEGWRGCFEKDFAEAYKLFTHAHRLGDKTAVPWLDNLSYWMSPDELAEGERRVREYSIESI
jgi:uncharacterized protein